MFSKSPVKILFSIVLFLMFSPEAHTTEIWIKNNTAVFVLYRDNPQLDNISRLSADRIAYTFSRLGRFMPVDNRTLKRVYKIEYDFDKEADPYDLYQRIARRLGLDIYVIVDTVHDGVKFISTATVIPLREIYVNLGAKIRIENRFPSVIPAKFSIETARMHEGLPLRVEFDCDDDSCLIYAGQWHGLEPGTYESDAGTVEIRATDRFFSRAFPFKKAEMDRGFLEIKTYPSTGRLISDSRNEIETLIINRLKLKGDREGTAEQKFVESLCVINPGASMCLPVYGSFLSISYFHDLPDSDPSMGGLLIGSLAVAFQLFYVPVAASSYGSDFFPWESGPDKTASLEGLHIYLWAALPLTFSAAYLDQLAFRLHRVERLPPFFEERDTAAAAFSFFIPGGGFFYKGHRELGWMFFFSETGLGAYAVYNRNSEKRLKWSLAGLAFLKGVSTVFSYFIDPAYDIFNRESGGARTEFNFSVRPDIVQGDIYYIGVNMMF